MTMHKLLLYTLALVALTAGGVAVSFAARDDADAASVRGSVTTKSASA
jgi:hypothetical protein